MKIDTKTSKNNTRTRLRSNFEGGDVVRWNGDFHLVLPEYPTLIDIEDGAEADLEDVAKAFAVDLATGELLCEDEDDECELVDATVFVPER